MHISIPFELTLGETLWASGFGALATAFFTAVFVTIGGRWIIMSAENRRADNIRKDDAKRTKDLREADERRANALLEADHARAEALQKADEERATLQRELSEVHDRRQMDHEHDFQSRRALRESYARLLVVQRSSRQASLALSKARDENRDDAEAAAIRAHNDFLDEYHRLALDADRPMWNELRRLREALDVMLVWAKEGDTRRCEELYKSARSARQNLEGRFRERLGYTELQDPKEIGDLSKPPGKSLL